MAAILPKKKAQRPCRAAPQDHAGEVMLQGGSRLTVRG